MRRCDHSFLEPVVVVIFRVDPRVDRERVRRHGANVMPPMLRHKQASPACRSTDTAESSPAPPSTSDAKMELSRKARGLAVGPARPTTAVQPPALDAAQLRDEVGAVRVVMRRRVRLPCRATSSSARCRGRRRRAPMKSCVKRPAHARKSSSCPDSRSRRRTRRGRISRAPGRRIASDPRTDLVETHVRHVHAITLPYSASIAAASELRGVDLVGAPAAWPGSPQMVLAQRLQRRNLPAILVSPEYDRAAARHGLARGGRRGVGDDRDGLDCRSARVHTRAHSGGRQNRPRHSLGGHTRSLAANAVPPLRRDSRGRRLRSTYGSASPGANCAPGERCAISA